MSANALLMLRPRSFGFNSETAASNKFQCDADEASSTATATAASTASSTAQTALGEFDNAVQLLRDTGLTVVVGEDTAEPAKPDAVFPNNWVSFHLACPAPLVVLYPMCAPNRRLERRTDVVEAAVQALVSRQQQHQKRPTVVDLSPFEGEEGGGRFLEGTGSMIVDHLNEIVYAAVSVRSDPAVLRRLATLLGYRAAVFEAVDASGYAVYHTNVLMSVADGFVVVAAESITEEPSAPVRAAVEAANAGTGSAGAGLAAVDAAVFEYCKEAGREGVDGLVQVQLVGRQEALQLMRCGSIETGSGAGAGIGAHRREVVEITLEQMGNFAGNMLEVVAAGSGQAVLVLSETAHGCLTEAQKGALGRHATLLPVPIPTIERHGGGSIRCMMCELR